LVVSQVKEKLKSNPDLIVNLLEKLGCHQITMNDKKNEIRCALPDGETNTSLQVMINDNITCNVYSRGSYPGGDIITLVQFIKKYKFIPALQWLCKEMQIEYDGTFETLEESKVFKLLKNYREKNMKEIIHPILDESLLMQYKNQIIQEWMDEGISTETQKKYEVKLDTKGNRIVFPIRNEENELVNIKGRTCIQNFKELGIKKYRYYYKLFENDLLYGLNYNKQNINICKEAILFESEKSVMKADSYKIYNTLALSTNSINYHQLRKLLQLKCNIVLALDKDVPYKDIIEEANKLKKFTNTYIIFDKNNLLNKKDSPIDKGLEVWTQLYNERMRV
jgi:DNA primase